MMPEQQAEAPEVPNHKYEERRRASIINPNISGRISGESCMIAPLPPPTYNQLYPKLPDPEMAMKGKETTERIKGKMDFSPGGQAIISCFTDLILLTCSIIASIAWMIWMEPITTFILGIDGDVFYDTIQTYSDMTGIESGRLTDGRIRSEYIYLNCAVDMIVSLVQIMAALLMIWSGPLPIKNLRRGMLVCGVWLVVNVAVFVGYTTWRILDTNWLTLLIGASIRGLFIFKILQFVWEIRRHM